MKAKLNSVFILCGVVFLVLVVRAPFAAARRAPSNQTPNSSQTSPGPGRQALTGTWKLNRAQSDDPAKKIVGDDNIPVGEMGTAVPTVGALGGGGQTGTNSQGGGGLSGMDGMGGMGASGMGGMGGGMGGGVGSLPPVPPSHRWETDKDRQKKMEYLMPADSLTIEQKDNEFDFVDGRERKQVFYTDGRKLRKPKDESLLEFDARWDAERLTYDEKRPPHGTVTRTFELSPDGRQLYETTEVDNGGFSVPVVIRYVYDAAAASAQR